MYRRKSLTPVSGGSMSINRARQIELLLSSRSNERSRTYAYARDRQDLHSIPILWIQENHSGIKPPWALHQSQASPKGHEEVGLSEQSTTPRSVCRQQSAQEIPLFTEWSRHYKTSAGVEHRYHVYSFEERFCVSGSRDRLVQPPCPVASPLQQPTRGFLCRCARRSGEHLWTSRNFQYRSRSPVHMPRVCQCSNKPGNPTQHGWQGSSFGQRICRTPLEVVKIRRGVST